MLWLWPSNLFSRHLTVLCCQKTDGIVWAQMTGIPTKHTLCPKSGKVQTHWDAMPRGLIHEAECEPSLWVTGGPPKQQLSPCGDHTCCCKENTAAVEGTCKFAIAPRMMANIS